MSRKIGALTIHQAPTGWCVGSLGMPTREPAEEVEIITCWMDTAEGRRGYQWVAVPVSSISADLWSALRIRRQNNRADITVFGVKSLSPDEALELLYKQLLGIHIPSD